MANLIITIISIAIIGIAAAMGVYYGGVAFEQGQINAMASGMINESQQVLLAMRTWAVNNGQLDANTVPSGGTNFGTLVSAGLLTGYPTGFAGMVNASEIGQFGHQWPYNAFYNCSTIGNDGGWLIVAMFTYHNGNYMFYYLDGGVGETCGNYQAVTKTANDSITKFALAVNKSMGVTASSNLTMSALGVPYAASTISDPANVMSVDGNDSTAADANGNLLTNMCFFTSPNLGAVSCVFGPS